MKTKPEVYAVDFETYYDDECSVGPLGPRAYTKHPKFDAYLVTIAGPNGWAWAGAPEDFNWNRLRNALVVSHNATFDKTVYLSLHEKDPDTFPSPDIFEEWNCTANLSAFLCNRRSLADSWQFFYGEEVSKKTRNEMKGQVWWEMTPEFQNKVMEYAIGDAVKCRRIWVDHAHKWGDTERELSRLTIESTIRGVAVDMEKARSFLSVCRRRLFDVEKGLPWMDGARDAKPTSKKIINEYCRLRNITPPPVKEEDEEAYIGWELAHKEQYPWVTLLGDWRQVNRTVRLLETIIKRAEVNLDETESGQAYYWMDTPLKYFGAHTGRWSGDSGLNFQNFRRDPLVVNGVPIDVRSLFIPRPGYRFVIADFAQIEPRCLAMLCGDDEFLRLVREGWSVYEAHAKACMGWKGKGLKKSDPKLYALAKASRLGLGYGCGAAKFQVVAKSLAGLELTPEQCKEAVESFREKNPKVTDLWGTLDQAFRDSARRPGRRGMPVQVEEDAPQSGTFRLCLPSGREMVYRDVRNEITTRVLKKGEKPPKDPSELLSKRAYANVGGTKKAFYGGRLCENLVQATARDVFVEGMLNVAAAGFHIPFHVHDEVIVEVPEGTPMKYIEELLTICPEWAEGVPIEVEAVESDCYKK